MGIRVRKMGGSQGILCYNELSRCPRNLFLNQYNFFGLRTFLLFNDAGNHQKLGADLTTKQKTMKIITLSLIYHQAYTLSPIQK